ncbi:MAG: cohesin domain-containing protein [Patescibacteria group bacterium]
MRKFFSTISLLIILILAPVYAIQAEAQTVFLDGSKLMPRIELSLSPRVGSFVEDSTFDIPILINTKGASINGLEITINFDKDKLEIVKPSSGQSIVGVWLAPPSYDNTRGLASYMGVIPSGITTSSGSVGTITFRAKKTGKAVVSVSANSKVLLNDGQGTEATVEVGRSEYTIMARAPEGVRVFSETHPFPSEWYNNDSPVVFWEKDPEVSGFSYLLDDKPHTIPENTISAKDTTKFFENLDDGLWYFHIKANRNGAWGTTGHFLMRIDTAPPADFKPEIDYLLAATILNERALVSFFTTDNLSGVDRYEIGVIDKSQPVTVSPVFVQAESPFQVPLTESKLSVIVRAVDKAGNIRDVSMAVGSPSLVGKFMKNNLVYILLFIIFAGLIGLILHYLVGHHIIRYLRKAAELVKKEEQTSAIEQDKAEKPNEITDNNPES